jgi:hypothetical protein
LRLAFFASSTTDENLFDTLAFDEEILDVDEAQIPDDVSTNFFQRGALGASADSSSGLSAFDDFVDPSSFDGFVELSSFDDFVELSAFDGFVELSSFDDFFDPSSFDGFVELSGFSGIGGTRDRFFSLGLGLARTTGFSGIWMTDFGGKAVRSSTSIELVATIFWITSGGGGAVGLGGGVFFLVLFLAPFSSDLDFDLDLESSMIGGSASSSSDTGIELTDSVDDDEDESRRGRALAVAMARAISGGKDTRAHNNKKCFL